MVLRTLDRYTVKPLIFFVDGDVSFALLRADLIAVVHMVADPAGDVLRGRIDVEHVVKILVVEGVLHYALDMRKIGDHAVGIEFLSLAIDGDHPVMAMQVLALTLVTEIEVVRGGDGECFFDVVHGV